MYPKLSILQTWKKFDSFPMETLTKAWYFDKGTPKKQRDVSQMKEHRERYGITGNCFDLVLWLLDEFKKDGVKAYPIGSKFNTEKAHVAVIALDENGRRYLCDLGDQWLTPILVDTSAEDFSNDKLTGFFPGAKIQVLPENNGFIEILYHRPNGKWSTQTFNLEPIEMNAFMQAAEFSQNHIGLYPLFECRIPYKFEVAHWEFYNWESFLSTNDGLHDEEQTYSIEHWVNVIHEKANYNKDFLFDALTKYKQITT
ncbi:hypothetical protein ABE41_006265 [Fictibacillus arsenicus]|uniref:Arylamine N-acetyltransferase n=1 Tax=Fictibacillus arsenicus TaxID=255247 RepID=A0A1B1Z287_9BACL|nr:hypothetical protein [Fictibacillus arsenicus]ANX11606.1 hypothetical protein ABE41_006265 [Fictibacillus arsenicus]